MQLWKLRQMKMRGRGRESRRSDFSLPRWRMRIVTAMRNLMPRVQFVITTHDPLCLRGVTDGEVIVVRRNSEGDVVSITEL